MAGLAEHHREKTIPASCPLGATYTGAGVAFQVWAPNACRVELHVVAPYEETIRMQPIGNGYHFVEAYGLAPGARYFYRLNEESDRPDPASRFQPEGVHGPSEVIYLDGLSSYESWQAPRLRDYIIYELHVGTFTPEGTLDAIIPHLGRLMRLGITALELMPLAEFPGGRNWGYDGVCPFSVHSCYGGPAALHRLVNACHERGMAVILDVVYNHLGPEGNYLREFGPYFTEKYRTPWGEALNFDGPFSDDVRRYFIENALYWIRDFRIDALRLDAVHAIFDGSAYSFLEQLTDEVHSCARKNRRNIYVIAESDLNDARLIRSKRAGGLNIDAQWADDLHHCIHTLLTGENFGYYRDYGSIEQLAEILRSGWAYSGQYSLVRQKHFGNSPVGLAPEKFVVCAQNHDQVGNRMLGERLSHLAGWDGAKLAAATILLSPFTPLLFMGEEYDEPAPFLYHVSHSDPELQEAVRTGRKQEFSEFHAQGEAPDPQNESTFKSSKLNQQLACGGRHATMHSLYATLISLRQAHPALRPTESGSWDVDCHCQEQVIEMNLDHSECRLRVVLNYGKKVYAVAISPEWIVLLDTADARWAAADSGNEQTDNTAPIVQPLACVVFSNCSHRG